VDREGLEELFAPFAVVSVRRMFSGHGVYFDGLCFALSIGGEVYLKVDAETQTEFAAVDSRPFVYAARGREVQVGYWLLPPAAFDDEDELRRWASLAFAAARRAADGKTPEGKQSVGQVDAAIGRVPIGRPRWRLAFRTRNATLIVLARRRRTRVEPAHRRNRAGMIARRPPRRGVGARSGAMFAANL
jgi:DNA transformation protein